MLIEQSAEGSPTQARALFDQLLEQALEREVITDAVIAESIDQSNRLWHARESIPLAQAKEGANLKHGIAVPISRIPAFLEATDRALRDALPAVRLITLGHVGDGNLHYNIQGPPGASTFDEAQAALISGVVYDSVAAHGGSISPEHGIGQSKVRELRRTKSPVALALMRDIKRALDPRNLLNPGRLLELD